jgi:hypothetical protein
MKVLERQAIIEKAISTGCDPTNIKYPELITRASRKLKLKKAVRARKPDFFIDKAQLYNKSPAAALKNPLCGASAMLTGAPVYKI